MQNIGLSQSTAANTADVRKDNEQHNVSVWRDRSSLSIQHLHGCSGLLFTCIMVTTGAVRTNSPVEVWPPFRAPCVFPRLCESCDDLQGWALTSPINNLCRHRRAVAPIRTAITILPLRPKDPGALFIKLQLPSCIRERCVPALPQPINEADVHTHPPAANNILYWAEKGHQRRWFSLCRPPEVHGAAFFLESSGRNGWVRPPRVRDPFIMLQTSCIALTAWHKLCMQTLRVLGLGD